MPITVSLDAEIVENFPYVGDLVKLAKNKQCNKVYSKGY